MNSRRNVARYVILGLFFVGLLLGFGDWKPYHNVKKEKLVSLRSNTETEGSLFLGSGNINGQEYYYFYEALGNGGYRLSKIPARSNVTIFEEDRSDGLLEVSSAGHRNTMFFGLVELRASFQPDTTTFRVPRGSIQRNFVLQ